MNPFSNDDLPLPHLLERIFADTPEAFLVLDDELTITAAGASFRRTLGLKEDENPSFLETVERFSLARVREVFEDLRQAGAGHRALELNHRLPDGEAVGMRYSWVACHDDAGRCRAFVGIGRPVDPVADAKNASDADEVQALRDQLAEAHENTERRSREIARLREELVNRTSHDELSGLGNRTFILDRLVEESERAVRYDQPMTLILVDIDRLAGVNEDFGRDQGDIVISGVAQVVREQIRGSDVAGRIEGGEFLVLCPHTDRASAQFLAERLRRRVAELSFTHEDEEFGTTVSLGLVTVAGKNHQFDNEALLAAADQALEAAKRGGTNRIQLVEV